MSRSTQTTRQTTNCIHNSERAPCTPSRNLTGPLPGRRARATRRPQNGSTTQTTNPPGTP
eukprot:5485040-Lingulodinium_polyedra.AAC.1